MASTSDVIAPAGDSTPILFRIPRARRIENIAGSAVIALVVLVGCGGILLAAVLSWLGRGPNRDVIEFLPALCLAFLVLLVTVATCQEIGRQLRFTLCITPDRLTFGGGLARSTIACEAVTVIRFRMGHPRKPKTQSLEIAGGQQKWTVRLGRDSVACLHLLGRLCRHAAVLGPRGIECLPSDSPPDPLRVRNSIRAAKHRTLEAVWQIVACAMVAAQLLLGTSDRLMPYRFAIWAGLAAMFALALTEAIRQRRRAQQIVRQWEDVTAAGRRNSTEGGRDVGR